MGKKLLARLKISNKGQSLVEMAIITPLLIFMLIGVFEVGWMLRTYLVLVNVNREITRFAVRPGYMNFSTQTNVITSYTRIRDWANNSLSGQLEFDFENDGSTTLVISHLVVDTGFPCENMATCDCEQVEDPDYANLFKLDDLIVHPDLPGMGYQATTFGPLVTETGTRTTRINYTDLVSNTLIPRNNRFNCQLIKKGGVPSADNIIITELFFDQNQLFGFPFISNPYTDPINLYTQTTMRLVGAARSSGLEGGDLTGGISTIGPVCNSYPFAVQDSTIAAANVGDTIDIFDGQGTNNHNGWLAWNPAKTGADDLALELQYSTASLNDFIDARDAGDTNIGVNDWVASLPGTHATVETDDGLVSLLVDNTIRVPVWDDFENGEYLISGFAWVKIESVDDIDLNNRIVEATYLGDASDACP